MTINTGIDKFVSERHSVMAFWPSMIWLLMSNCLQAARVYLYNIWFITDWDFFFKCQCPDIKRLPYHWQMHILTYMVKKSITKVEIGFQLHLKPYWHFENSTTWKNFVFEAMQFVWMEGFKWLAYSIWRYKKLICGWITRYLKTQNRFLFVTWTHIVLIKVANKSSLDPALDRTVWFVNFTNEENILGATS